MRTIQVRNEAQKLAIKQAFIRLTSDASWPVLRELAEEVVYNLEQKALTEDDRDKRDAYIFDARGARKFWAEWLRQIELAKNGEPLTDTFLEVVTD